MNWIDLILILILFFSIVRSVQRGFLITAADLICWAGSLLVGFYLYEPISAFLSKHIALGPWSAPLTFMVLLIASRLLLEEAARRIFLRIPTEKHDSTVNKILGIFPGILHGFLWLSLLSVLLLLLPIGTGTAEEVRKSKLNDWVISKVNWMQDQLSPVFGTLMSTVIHNPQAALAHKESIKLNFQVTNAQTRADLEAQMLDLVNGERQKNGLKPLKADPEIAITARKHSADMLAKGYFSHSSADGKMLSDRLRADYIVFRAAGENLALAQNLSTAHQGLMNSPAHRANILQPAFGRLGIGILDAGIYGLMITQNFRN